VYFVSHSQNTNNEANQKFGFLHIARSHSLVQGESRTTFRFLCATASTDMTTPTAIISSQLLDCSSNSAATTWLLEQPQKRRQRNQKDDRRYEHACKIWYQQLPQGKATSDFQALTPQEREQVWADLTGNDLLSHSSQRLQQFSKSPQDLQLLLGQLHQRLMMTQQQQQQQQQQHDNDDALWMVLQSSPTYACQHYTRFLASQEWNVEHAFETMRAHFGMKRDLFGMDLLGRDILLSDLDSNTMKCLESGGYQYSYFSRDRAERAFVLLNASFMTHQPFTKIECMVRWKGKARKQSMYIQMAFCSCCVCYWLFPSLFVNS
jgi:hypothetical protein